MNPSMIVAITALVFSLWAIGTARWRKWASEVAQEPSEVQEELDPYWPEEEEGVIEVGTLIEKGIAYLCNSCGEIAYQPPTFATKIELEMPFLDTTLPIHVFLCEDCVA
jgi:hypothetical protein